MSKNGDLLIVEASIRETKTFDLTDEQSTMDGQVHIVVNGFCISFNNKAEWYNWRNRMEKITNPPLKISSPIKTWIFTVIAGLIIAAFSSWLTWYLNCK